MTYSFDPLSGAPLFACYVTGHFQGLTVFGNIPLAASGGSPDVFVAKYDGNGNVLWAKKAGGAGRDQGLGIAIDPFPTMSDLPVPLSHASYVTGYCTETAVFGGVSLAGSGSSPDIFVAKYDGAGNVLWAKRAGGEGSGQGLGIAVEQSSSSLDLETGAPVFASHVTGYFAGMTSFGEIPLASSGNNDIFVAKLGLENAPPLADAGLDLSADEAGSISFDGSGSSDPDGDPLTYAWTQLPGGSAVVLTGAATATPSFTAPFVSAGGQDLTFNLTVDDGQGHTATDAVVVRVENKNDPPTVDAAQPTVSVLWPPNQQMVGVGITGVRDLENNATLIITGVTQDEPANGLGDGDTAVDAVIEGATALLRAERSGKGDGRVYRVSFTASDFEGGASGVVFVTVPQSRKGLAIDSGGVFSPR